MPKVTSVEPQKKTLRLRSGQGPKRFNIFLDGEFAFGADEDLIVSHRLIPGKVIEKSDLDKLLYEVEIGKLMERMYGLFSVRQRSEKEVKTYLKNLSFKRKIKDKEEISDITIDLLVERLKQKGLVNDLEFAKAWVEGRRKSKQKGELVLRVELIQKGISRDIIEEVLGSKSQVISEEELARQALGKKMKAWKNLKRVELKKKATEFLLRRGFSYSMAKNAVENILDLG